MARIVGIDLGTTFSASAVVRPDGRPTVLINREGFSLTPSAVLFDGSEIIVGEQAKNAATTSPETYVQFVKRQMGNPHWRFVDGNDIEYRPEEISAIILRRLADDAAAALGEPVHDVVVTVPAYFDDARRKATRDAGEIAGLNVLRLVNEPTAAAIAYGMDSKATGTILVYDLGGGTFDVTLMRADNGEFQVIATDGDRNLGGYDFDNALMRHVAAKVVDQGGPDLRDDPLTDAALRERCEKAKHTLSNVSQVSVRLTAGGQNFTVPVTRAEFEAMTADLLERTEIAVTGLFDELRPPMGWTDVDHLLLVGGSTRMPMVREMIQRVSGKTPVAGVNPDEAVALGAAIVGATLATTDRPAGLPSKIGDVTSQGLGIVAYDLDTLIAFNSIIIPKNTRIPVERDREYVTLEPNQRRLDVQVTAGNEDDLDYATVLKTKPIGLPAGLPLHAPLKCIMSYDLDGIIHVELIDLTSGKSQGEFELLRDNNLTDAEKVAARNSMRGRLIQ